MLIDEVKKANIEFIKARDSVAKNIIGIIVNKYMLCNIEKRASGQEAVDADLVSIIQKTIKELEEEAENYGKVLNEKGQADALRQKEVIERFLPSMLSDEEIIKIISSLEDKSIPSVMKHFKTNYNGKVDMKRVNELAR